MGNAIKIIEVGPRDGLQRLSTQLSTQEKIQLIHDLVDSGIQSIQVTSFVHPKIVPQMADAEAVCKGIDRKDGVDYTALILNQKGLERAYDSAITHIDMSVSASNAHSRKNTNMTLDESLAHFDEMIVSANEMGMNIRVGIQCAFGYYEPDVTSDLVLAIAEQFLEFNISSLALADSTGMANPAQIKAMVTRLQSILGDVPLVLHLHDTRGMGLANVVAAIEAGCTQFDTAFGGMGGCNFIPDALGNIATEDTVNMLHEMGYETGIDLEQVAAVSKFLEAKIGSALPGKMYSLVS